MSRLPVPGSDDDIWGQVLNDFLDVAHNNDGSLQAQAITLAGGVTSINNKTASAGNVTLTAADIGAPTALSGDSDVSIASPANNQVLTYANGKWTNQNSLSGVALDSTASDIQPLGNQSAGATGKAADAGHIHAMPRLDQVSNPTAAVSLNSQKITNLANGTNPQDAVAYGQLPTAGTSNTNYTAGNATVGGDLSGTLPNPTVGKIKGITLPSLSPTGSGQVLISTSASATAWSTPSTNASSIDGVSVTGTPTSGQVIIATSGAAAGWNNLPSAPSNATSSTAGLIQLNGDLGNTATSPEVTSTHLSSALPVNQGGTGSASQNFVDLSTTQSVGGNKTFTATTTFNNTIQGNISGNAATVTTNANVTGDVTSVGNITTLTNSTNVESIISSNSTVTSKAPLASPSFTGVPAAPTATSGTNTSQIATTSFVETAVTNGVAQNATSSAPGLVQLDGDLGGSATSPVVEGIKGVAISGSPSSGQVLTATSGIAAAWAAPTTGSGSSTLAGDTDVSIASPANSQVLTYNAAAGKWENMIASSGVTLDSTASDIQADSITGSAVVGSTGLAADAGHQHPLVVHDHTTTARGGNIPIGGIATTGTASSSTYLRGDGAWNTPPTASDATSSSTGLVQLDNDLGGTAASPTVVSTHLASPLSLSQGGTGSALQNFVSLAGDLGNTVTTPQVESIQGVSISGTPSKGQALIASSGSAASWSGSLSANRVYVDTYGADPTGATDSTSAFVAAQAAGGSGAYQLVLGVGTYVLGTTSDMNTFGPNQGMIGQGSTVTMITYKGSATCVNIYQTPFNSSSNGGSFGGYSISGTGAGSTAIAMSWGNMQGARCHDITIESFGGASAIGLQFKNVGSSWSEQAEWTAIKLIQNTVNILFDTGSYDYSLYQFLIVANAGQDGVRMQNNCSLEGCRFELRGNFYTGTGNTAAVFAIDRGNSSGQSRIDGAQVFVNVETDGGTGVGHYTILMNGGSSSQFTGTGVLEFHDITGSFQGYTNTGGAQFGFSGFISEITLGFIIPSDALIVQGGTQWNVHGSLTSQTFAQIYTQFGDVQCFQLPSGNTTAALYGIPGTRARRIELYIAQPASGSAGTITWPTNVYFPGGAPTLSTTNGAIDRVRLTYVPSSGNWFCELTGTGYVSATSGTAPTTVNSISAADTSIVVVSGTSKTPSIKTGTLDAIANDHPPVANWSNNGNAISGVSDLAITGITGATASSRYVGATTSGAPTTGTFAAGDFVIDQTSKMWVCTIAGTPGTWNNTANSPVFKASTGSGQLGQYQKVATVTITLQFDDCTVKLLVNGEGSGAQIASSALVTWRVSQTAALGTAPFESVYVDNGQWFSPSNFISVIESVTGSSSVVSLWVQAPTSFENYTFYQVAVNPYANSSFESVAYSSNSSVWGAIDSGTQAIGVAGPSYGMPMGLTGATAATRYVGATSSGAPTTGTFAIGDFAIDQSGKAWICTSAGSPGTWSLVGAGAVTSVTAADTSVVVGGTSTAPTVRTSTLDVIASDHPPVANWSNNGNAISGVSYLAISGLTGATAASRYVGATTLGHPTSGTFAQGDYVVDQTGLLWICTVAGTPGTWITSSATIDATATDILPVGAQAAGSVGKAADAGHVHPDLFGGFDALGTIIGQTMPFVVAGNSALLASAGVLLMCRILVPVGGTTSALNMYVTTVGNTLSNVYAALVNSSGVIVAQTANRASDAVLITTGGTWQPPWSSSATVAAGVYYGCLMIGSATTMPTFESGPFKNPTVANLGCSAAAGNLRAAQYSSGLSSLPASVTMSSITPYQGLLWMAIT
jgi:hypothetical protein